VWCHGVVATERTFTVKRKHRSGSRVVVTGVSPAERIGEERDAAEDRDYYIPPITEGTLFCCSD
jgi:hypothetical protein